MLKLTFFKDGGEKVDLVLTGKDESELLEKWNELPHWAAWGPDRFRWRLVEFSGADKEKYTKTPVQMPAPDEEILAAVVDALGPRSVKLEHEGDQG